MTHPNQPASITLSELRGLRKNLRATLPLPPKWGSLDAKQTAVVLSAHHKAQKLSRRNRRNSNKHQSAMARSRAWDVETPHGTFLGGTSGLLSSMM
jgi:hypothetical protein